MHYYPHHIGDYNKKTLTLSVTEHGVYRVLMDAYYVSESPLPSDLSELCRVCRAMSKAEREAVKKVSEKFFELRDGLLFHERIESEIQNYRHNAEINKENGKKGGRPPKQKPKNNPSGFDSLTEGLTETKGNQEPVTNNHINTPPNPQGGRSDKFELFWKAYPKKQGKGDAERAWKKIKLEDFDTIIAAVMEQKASYDWQKEGGQFIPSPSKWLNAKRWQDETEAELIPQPRQVISTGFGFQYADQ